MKSEEEIKEIIEWLKHKDCERGKFVCNVCGGYEGLQVETKKTIEWLEWVLEETPNQKASEK